MNVWRYEENGSRISIADTLFDCKLPVLVELNNNATACYEVWFEMHRDDVVSLRDHLNRLLEESK